LGVVESISAIEKEEQEFLKAYQKKRLPALLSLQEKMGLDFFAVDCSFNIKGGLLLFKVDCDAHYMDNLKTEGSYSLKQINRFNEAVETMIVNKLKNGQVRHV